MDTSSGGAGTVNMLVWILAGAIIGFLLGVAIGAWALSVGGAYVGAGLGVLLGACAGTVFWILRHR